MGVGIGLRRPHFDRVFETPLPVGWVELLSENFMAFGGRPRHVARKAASHWPVVCHGVGLNLASLDPIATDYLSELKTLVEEVKAPWFSDHLCFSASNGHSFHDLIPAARTEESVANVVDRIRRARDFVGVPFAVENVSTYVESRGWEMSEPEFLSSVVDKSECLLLLDINNIFVNAKNHGFDADKYLDAIPLSRVVQVHLAGHYDRGDVRIDTHGEAVCPEVWQLYRSFLKKAKRPIATLIEWDNDIPSLERLIEEAERARTILREEFE